MSINNGNGRRKPKLKKSTSKTLLLLRAEERSKFLKNPSDQEILAKVEALSPYLSVQQIADYFGIRTDTFYRAMHKHKELERSLRRGKARLIAEIADSLIAKARAGNIASMCFFLKTQAGWRETTRVEHAGDGENPVLLRAGIDMRQFKLDLSAFSIEELKALEKLGIELIEKKKDKSNGVTNLLYPGSQSIDVTIERQ